MIVEDLDAYLADHGDPVMINGVEFTGILDQPDQNLALGTGPAMQSRTYQLLMKTSDVAAAGIARGTQLIIGSTVYAAHNPVQVDDGAFSNIPLSAQ